METTQKQHPEPYSPLLAECLKTLRERETDLHARGILHVGIFGSVARGEGQDESDVDIIVDVAHNARFGILDLVHLRNELVQAFGRSVDVVSTSALKSPKHDRILKEMVRAF